MSFLAIAILSINFFACLFCSIFLSNQNSKKQFFKLPVVVQKGLVLVVFGPVFIAPLVPQYRFNMSEYISLPIGISLFVLGWIPIILALCKFGTIPGVRKKSNLITTGIYGIVRHPIYSGTLIAVLGLTILLKSIISIAYFPVLVLLYFLGLDPEERILIEQYGDEYIEYKKKVPKRLIPFII